MFLARKRPSPLVERTEASRQEPEAVDVHLTALPLPFDDRADRAERAPGCHPPASSPFSVGTTEPPTSICDGRSPSAKYVSLMCMKLWRPILVPCSLSIET